MTEEQHLENYIVRSIKKAVLAVERDLGPWDVRVTVVIRHSLYSGFITDQVVGFRARGKFYRYRLRMDGSDFRSNHLQRLMQENYG